MKKESFFTANCPPSANFSLSFTPNTHTHTHLLSSIIKNHPKTFSCEGEEEKNIDNHITHHQHDNLFRSSSLTINLLLLLVFGQDG
jgi:hypothetical protein